MQLPVEVVKDKFKTCLKEYLQEADLDEIQEGIAATNAPHCGHEIVKQVIILALNMKNRERELASKLLAVAHDTGLVPKDQIEDGFIRLVWRLDDLVLDTPDAPTMLAQFAARAIADGILPEFANFVRQVPELLLDEGSLGGDFASKLRLYRSKHNVHFKHPEDMWGAGCKPVDALKASIRAILGDFFATGDVAECLKSVQELEAPHFLHELVSKSIIISLDHGTPGQLRAHLLLQTAAEQGLLTPTQVAQGLERVLNSLHDIVIDVPNAPVLVARFLFQAFEDGWASRELLDERKGGPWGEAFSRGDMPKAKKAAYEELARLAAL